MKYVFSITLLIFFISSNAQQVENRVDITRKLKNKIEAGKPLIVHAFVPLCDNEHQGIVPTTESLGNGMSTKSNLYWATSKGVKRFFKERSDWKLLKTVENPNKNVLERVIFSKTFSNSAEVILIADAYRGDRMKATLDDFFNSLSGHMKGSVELDNKEILHIYENADLFIFNGHNGLMDTSTDYESAVSNRAKDAVSIACISNSYFKDHYKSTHSYPLVHTTNLLFPGAFIMEGVINAWAMLGTDEECKLAADKGYYKHKPKSGPNGSQNLFDFGW